MKTIDQLLEELANAIILQAVEDYRDALKGKDVYRNRTSPAVVISECERFFLSDWFKVLTNVNGEYLMRTIRKEFMN
jgi:hypothetical protein